MMGASGICVGSLVELPAGPDAVEGVNRPDVTPSTALLRLSYNRKNQVPRAFELPGALRAKFGNRVLRSQEARV